MMVDLNITNKMKSIFVNKLDLDLDDHSHHDSVVPAHASAFPRPVLLLSLYRTDVSSEAQYWCQKFDETELTFHEGSRLNSLVIYSLVREEYSFLRHF